MNSFSYKIRKANIADIKAIVRIERESFPAYPYPSEAFYYFYRKCPDLFLLAEYEGEVVGYVLGCSEDDSGHVISIAVSHRFRKRGIGRALMMELEKKMAEKGIRKVRLEVSASNEVARKMYNSLGYREIGILRRYYPDGNDAIVMEKSLYNEIQAT